MPEFNFFHFEFEARSLRILKRRVVAEVDKLVNDKPINRGRWGERERHWVPACWLYDRCQNRCYNCFANLALSELSLYCCAIRTVSFFLFFYRAVRDACGIKGGDGDGVCVCVQGGGGVLTAPVLSIISIGPLYITPATPLLWRV